MNHMQFDKCTVLKYSPLQSTMTLKPGLRVIQGHCIKHHSTHRRSLDILPMVS